MIGVDLRPMESYSRYRGIGYYNLHLFSKILEIAPKGDFIIYTKFFTHLPKTLNKGIFWKVPIVLRPIRAVRKFDPIVRVFWRLALILKKPSVLHITSLFEVYYLSVPRNIPTVVTVYDLIPMLFSKDYFQNEKAKEWYVRRLNQIKSATRVITISESAKKDIQKVLKIPASKIDVVYCGIDDRFKLINKLRVRKLLEKKYKISGKYVLSIGSTTINKNVPRIFEAFKKYVTKYQIGDLNLVVVCRLEPQEKKYWLDMIKKMGIEGKIRLTNFIPDEDMPYFYSGAELLLFPSLYEGFGLPIAEAMACGTPVITSKASSMLEVGGEAAYFVNPKKTESIALGLKKVLEDNLLRKKMIKKGFIQARKFSWEKAAKKTLAVYQKILNLE